MAAGARLADVAGEHERQVCRAVHLGGVEPVIDPFALMNRHRFHGRDILGELLDHRFGRLSDFDHGVEVVVLEVGLVERPQGGDFDLFAVDELDFEGSVEPGVEPFFR